MIMSVLVRGSSDFSLFHAALDDLVRVRLHKDIKSQTYKQLKQLNKYQTRMSEVNAHWM